MSNNVCVECKSEIPAESDFCPECGFPAAGDAKRQCPECQNLISAESEACPECGLPLALPSEAFITQAALPAEASEVPPAAFASSSAEAPRVKSQQETIVIRSVDAGEDLVNEVLKAQILSHNDVVAALGRMIDASNNGAVTELLTKIAGQLESADASKNDMLGDLITSINRFVDSSEKIKNDMVAEMKEQNLITLSSMQEIATSVSRDINATAEGIKQAQAASLAEMNNIAQQIKAAAPTETRKSGSADYLLYICAVMLVFMSLNIIVTAYVVKLVRGLY